MKGTIIKTTLILSLFIILGSLLSTAQITSGTKVDVYVYSQSPDPVQPGNYVELRLKIENTGVEPLDDFRVELLPEYPFSLDPDEEKIKQYGTVGGGQFGDNGIIAKWNVRVAPDAVEGENELRVRYQWGSDAWIYETITINVRTISTIFSVKQISTVPEKIQPGDSFTLNIEAQNLADTFIKNIDVKLNITSPFVTLDSTNEQSLRLLEAGESKNISFKMISEGDADQTIYKIPADISFYDNQNNKYTKEISFGLVLLQDPEIITNLEDTEIYTSGDRGQITLSVSNIGVDEIKFLKAYLEPTDDYQVLSSNEIYLGNVNSDDFESATYNIYVKSKKDSVPLRLRLEYGDSLNNPFTENHTIMLPLYSNREARNLGLKEGTNFLTSYIGFVVMVFLLIFWAYMLFDLLQRKMMRYKKIGWFVALILTTIFGALLYYFMVKRRDHNA